MYTHMARRPSLTQVQKWIALFGSERNGVIKILAGEDLCSAFLIHSTIPRKMMHWSLPWRRAMRPTVAFCVRVNEIFAIYDKWVWVERKFGRELERHFVFRNTGQRSTHIRPSCVFRTYIFPLFIYPKFCLCIKRVCMKYMRICCSI